MTLNCMPILTTILPQQAGGKNRYDRKMKKLIVLLDPETGEIADICISILRRGAYWLDLGMDEGLKDIRIAWICILAKLALGLVSRMESKKGLNYNTEYLFKTEQLVMAQRRKLADGL